VKSIEVDEGGVFVECRISGGGSIRVEEVLMLLGSGCGEAGGAGCSSEHRVAGVMNE